MQPLVKHAFVSSDVVQRIERTSLRPTLARAPGVISLAMGEPDFDTPGDIIDAAIDALRSGHTRYTDPVGEIVLVA